MPNEYAIHTEEILDALSEIGWGVTSLKVEMGNDDTKLSEATITAVFSGFVSWVDKDGNILYPLQPKGFQKRVSWLNKRFQYLGGIIHRYEDDGEVAPSEMTNEYRWLREVIASEKVLSTMKQDVPNE